MTSMTDGYAILLSHFNAQSHCIWFDSLAQDVTVKPQLQSGIQLHSFRAWLFLKFQYDFPYCSCLHTSKPIHKHRKIRTLRKVYVDCTKELMCCLNIIWFRGTHLNVISLMPVKKVWPSLCQFLRNSQMLNSIVSRSLTEFHPNQMLNVESVDRNSLMPLSKA
jgi:hypothetical protein